MIIQGEIVISCSYIAAVNLEVGADNYEFASGIFSPLCLACCFLRSPGSHLVTVITSSHI
jgi:hypothetical protein